jgi:hypothetical protein
MLGAGTRVARAMPNFSLDPLKGVLRLCLSAGNGAQDDNKGASYGEQLFYVAKFALQRF